MRALNYPPHITLAVYDEVALESLYHGVEAAFEQLPSVAIRFGELKFFETPQAMILWAAPTLPAAVLDAHSAIHQSIGTALCRANYRPGVWIPHSTVATAIPLERKREVVELIAAPFRAIEVAFDALDCVSFSPVRVLKELALDR